MDWLDALILGLVQGLAEFLPISSSGHLEIFGSILGLKLAGEEALDFDVTLHVATALSTILVLWHEFVPLCKSFFTLKNDDNTRYVLKILLSAVPIAIVGVFLKDHVEGLFGGNLLVVGICLIITAILLTITHWVYSRRYITPERSITWVDALVIGVAQALAVFPGLSRSGMTISTGIIIGDKRSQVSRFAFLMVLVPIFGQAILNLYKFFTTDTVASVGAVPMIVGFVTAFVVGCAACKWMLDIVKKGKLVYFAFYCIAVGILCLCW